MPVPTAVKPEEGKSALPGITAPVVPPSEPASHSNSAETPEATCKTAELLKHWPAVAVATEKSRNAYTSIKQSAGIISWSLNLTEKAVGSVLKFAENVSSLRPVIEYADKTVSDGVVAIEKKFPVVRESPEELYNAVTQEIAKVVRPTLDKIASISEIGRKKLNRAAKKITKAYYSLLRTVEEWMDKLEKKLNGAEPEVVPGTESNAATVAPPPAAAAPAAAETPVAVAAPSPSRVRQAVQFGARAATAVAAFQLGAAFWLLSQAPLVGGFFREAAAPSPSSSSSSSSDDVPSSSSSSRQTPPAAAEEPSLHPEQPVSVPPVTTSPFRHFNSH